MNLSIIVCIITGLLYAILAIDQGIKGNIPILIMYGGYVIANIGLFFMVK